MRMSREQMKKLHDDRQGMQPEERRTAALEYIGDNLRNIYDAISELRVEVARVAQEGDRPKFREV